MKAIQDLLLESLAEKCLLEIGPSVPKWPDEVQYRQQENLGVARIKAEFDRYIEEYWPGVLAPGRISRIQLTSATQKIISKKEAADLLGSRLERIDKLVQQGYMTPIVFKGKAHYLRDQVEALANEISSNWMMAKACEALEVTRYQLKQLLDALP